MVSVYSLVEITRGNFATATFATPPPLPRNTHKLLTNWFPKKSKIITWHGKWVGSINFTFIFHRQQRFRQLFVWKWNLCWCIEDPWSSAGPNYGTLWCKLFSSPNFSTSCWCVSWLYMRGTKKWLELSRWRCCPGITQKCVTIPKSSVSRIILAL